MKMWIFALIAGIVVFGFLFSAEIGNWLDKETAKNNAKHVVPKNVTVLANSTNITNSIIDLNKAS
jgi:hypothetical protein